MNIQEYKSLPSVKKKSKQKKEESLQIQVSSYIKHYHPSVIFTSESSGLYVPIGVAVKMKKQRSNHKLPDMIILKPMKQYHGLCLELKKEGTTVWLKNGSLSSDKHIQEQAATLSELVRLGFIGEFAIGYNHAVSIIDKYLSL